MLKSILKRGAVLASAMTATMAFVGCGDDITEMVEGGSRTVASIKDAECTAENDGETVFAEDEGALYVCSNEKWVNVSGAAGSAAGAVAGACSVAKFDADSVYFKCGDKTTAVPMPKVENGKNGTNGTDGKNGDNGTSCKISKTDEDFVYFKCGSEETKVAIPKLVDDATAEQLAKVYSKKVNFFLLGVDMAESDLQNVKFIVSELDSNTLAPTGKTFTMHAMFDMDYMKQLIEKTGDVEVSMASANLELTNLISPYVLVEVEHSSLMQDHSDEMYYLDHCKGLVNLDKEEPEKISILSEIKFARTQFLKAHGAATVEEARNQANDDVYSAWNMERTMQLLSMMAGVKDFEYADLDYFDLATVLAGSKIIDGDEEIFSSPAMLLYAFFMEGVIVSGHRGVAMETILEPVIKEFGKTGEFTGLIKSLDYIDGEETVVEMTMTDMLARGSSGSFLSIFYIPLAEKYYTFEDGGVCDQLYGPKKNAEGKVIDNFVKNTTKGSYYENSYFTCKNGPFGYYWYLMDADNYYDVIGECSDENNGDLVIFNGRNLICKGGRWESPSKMELEIGGLESCDEEDAGKMVAGKIHADNLYVCDVNVGGDYFYREATYFERTLNKACVEVETTEDGYTCDPETHNWYGSLETGRDGEKVYKTMKVGDQVWMAENIAYIDEDFGSADYKCEDKDCNNILYPWHTAMKVDAKYDDVFISDRYEDDEEGYAADSAYVINFVGKKIQGICPSGWRIPSQDEFKNFVRFVGNDFYRNKPGMFETDDAAYVAKYYFGFSGGYHATIEKYDIFMEHYVYAYAYVYSDYAGARSDYYAEEAYQVRCIKDDSMAAAE